MSSEKPKIVLTIGEEDFEATPDNSSIFTFAGELALYDHVFIQTQPEEAGRTIGTYVFKVSPAFEKIFSYMTENGYPAHINQTRIPECDLNAYEQTITNFTKDLSDLTDYDEGMWK